MKNIHIIGTGGLAKELISYIEGEKNKRYYILGAWGNENFNNIKFSKFYSGNITEFKNNYRKGELVIIAIANNVLRQDLVKKEFIDLKISYETYIHPSCEISPFSTIGKGCVVCAQVIFTGDCKIGDHNFFNTECVVGHDTVIEDFSCFFPKIEICGDCHIESLCTFGISSIVLPGVRMLKGSKLDAMSILKKSVKLSALFAGNPAKPVKIYQ